MELPATVHRFEALAGLKQPLHLAIGIFDGLHLGHKSVIESALFSAQRSSGLSGVLTFDPHPSWLFRPENPTQLMMPIEKKSIMLHHIGVDLVIRQHFDLDYASIEAEDFLAHLKKALPALAAVYVGTDFRFGKNRVGDVQMLVETGQALGLAVFSTGRIKYNGEVISSTRIRENLEKGKIESVNDLLGYNYCSDGRIVSGASLGREIGFPTLNLPWQPGCRPCFGVYFVRFRSGEVSEWLYGVANYGIKPTVAKKQSPILEVHALSKTELKEGDAIVVEWLRFIRSEQKFESIEGLKAQIGRDCALARQFLPNE